MLFTDVLGTPFGDAAPAIYVGLNLLVFAAVLRNVQVPGMALAAVGAGCNLAAIIANGGYMPADPEALASVGLGGPGYTNSIVLTDPALPFLTDIFAMPAWMPAANIFSIGDVLLGAGVALDDRARDAPAAGRGGQVPDGRGRRLPPRRLARQAPDAMTLPDIGSSLPEVVLRTAVVYLFLVVVLRVSGKREVGQMSILELIVILIISDAVQNSMVGENATLWGGLVAVLTLLALDFGLKALTSRSRRLRRAVEGEPRLLVRDGRLLDKALREEGVEPEQVRAAVRAQGIARVEDVRLAVLETDGSISVIPKGEGATEGPPGGTWRLDRLASGRRDVGLEELEGPVYASRRLSPRSQPWPSSSYQWTS